MIIKRSTSVPSVSKRKDFIQPTLCLYDFPMKVLHVKLDLLAQLRKKSRHLDGNVLFANFK